MELLATGAALAFCALATLPLLSATADSRRAVCHNNLRQVGQGVQLWGEDHDDLAPWMVDTTDGGTRIPGTLRTSLPWAEFITLSNQLASPAVFACPADEAVRRAPNWGTGAGGMANSGFRNNALSYVVGFHTTPLAVHSVLAADRGLRGNGIVTSCSRGVNNALEMRSTDGPYISWTNGPHVEGGNILRMDGSVLYAVTPQLTNVLFEPSSGNFPQFHYVNPR